MMGRFSDEKLRQAFQTLRAREHFAAPPYQRVVAGQSGRGGAIRRSRWLLASAVAAVGLVLALLVVRRPLPRGSDDVALLRSWQSPTAFLLPSPARWLGTTPRLGAAVPGSPLRALDPGGPLGPPLSRSPRI